MKPLKTVICYASGAFKESQKRCCESALQQGRFDRAIPYTSIHIDLFFKWKHRTIFRNPRGAGLWLWKPYLIQKTLTRMEEGEILCYCDSGAEWIHSVDPLIEIALQEPSGIVTFALDQQERAYTQRDALILTGSDTPRYTQTPQLAGSYFLFRNNPIARAVVEQWFFWCTNPHLLQSSPSRLAPEYPDFVAHREDQSLWSLTCKHFEITPHRDPSQFGNSVKESSDSYPQLINHHRNRT